MRPAGFGVPCGEVGRKWICSRWDRCGRDKATGRNSFPVGQASRLSGQARRLSHLGIPFPAARLSACVIIGCTDWWDLWVFVGFVLKQFTDSLAPLMTSLLFHGGTVVLEDRLLPDGQVLVDGE